MWPDFGGGSIVDLMHDVVRSRGGTATGASLRDVDTSGWRDARTLVLLVLDGVGMAQLDLLPADSFLRSHCVATLTSVFPSTTAAAITSFMTAVPPAVHGLTGWHLRCSEPGLEGRVLAILPVTQRGGTDLPFGPDEILARVCRAPSLFASLSVDSRVISPADIVDSPFNMRHSAGAGRVGYVDLDGMLDAMTAALRSPAPPAYVYAYWPHFDHCAHTRGASSDSARDLLREVDAALAAWTRDMADGEVQLVITADHGFIDAPVQRLLELEHLPDLAACLSGPLSGERRAVFCHVKPGMARDFERAVQSLDQACVVWRSVDLLTAGRFGAGEPHPRLLERIGDYTLEMKADWTLRDTVPGERAHRLIGVHGGTSDAEMRVPLVLCEPGIRS